MWVGWSNAQSTQLIKKRSTMEITGKLIQKLHQQTRPAKNGPWIKQEFIIETPDQFPRKVCIALWGDKARDLDAVSIGESLKASINKIIRAKA